MVNGLQVIAHSKWREQLTDTNKMMMTGSGCKAARKVEEALRRTLGWLRFTDST